MGFSAVAKLQLARVVLLSVCVIDVVASTLLLTRVGDIIVGHVPLKDILVNEVRIVEIHIAHVPILYMP